MKEVMPCCARARDMSRMAEGEFSSVLRPAMPWMWVSIRPGQVICPRASMIFVLELSVPGILILSRSAMSKMFAMRPSMRIPLFGRMLPAETMLALRISVDVGLVVCMVL